MNFKVGTVTHFYEFLSVAVVELLAPLHVGDRIRISGKNDFSQLVESIQVDHEQKESAEAGETVGLKVKTPVEAGDEIVKLSA